MDTGGLDTGHRTQEQDDACTLGLGVHREHGGHREAAQNRDLVGAWAWTQTLEHRGPRGQRSKATESRVPGGASFV